MMVAMISSFTAKRLLDCWCAWFMITTPVVHQYQCYKGVEEQEWCIPCPAYCQFTPVEVSYVEGSGIGVDMPELKDTSEPSSAMSNSDALESEFRYGVLLPLPGLVV
jgi:hypothetical protein